MFLTQKSLISLTSKAKACRFISFWLEWFQDNQNELEQARSTLASVPECSSEIRSGEAESVHAYQAEHDVDLQVIGA